MEFGFAWFTRGAAADAAGAETLALAGERLGFRYMLVPDHVVIPADINSTYPYSPDGSFPGQGIGSCLDTLASIAFIAGRTRTMRLLTSVMVVPHRPPLLTAKMISTIDVLSGGRVTIGCGAGWMEEEFKALQLPDFAERGRVTDEYLNVFKTVWTNEVASFDGDYVSFSNVSTLPLPVQNPHPPLWIGGESTPAMRRAARLGDAWYPIGNNPRFPMDTLPRLTRRAARLEELCAEEGRDPATLGRAYWSHWNNENQVVKNADGDRMLLTGSVDAMVDDINQMKALGFRHLMMNFAAPDVTGMADRMQVFAEQVMPRID